MISLSNVSVALALALASTSLAAPSPSPLKNSPKRFSGGYIVEFEKSKGNQRAPDFFTNLTNSNIDATPRLHLSHDLFNGASFVLADAHNNNDTVAKIQSFSAVKGVWPILLYNRPAADLTVLKGASSAAQATRRDIQERDAITEDTYPVHVMGGVDKLRNEGYSGEGITVAIVDTGVDYNHPALGGGYGPGFKIGYTKDLVGDAYDGTNTPIPDDDVMDCAGHGTHVAGIVGANPNEYGFTGVVPNATLAIFKVFGCADNVGTDVLIDAFNQAHEYGVDVITSSIGGRNGWTEDIWDVAVQRIVEAGTPCTIAAGNDGLDGVFSSSGAADAIGAISVGSVENIALMTQLTAADATVNSTTATFGYAPGTTKGDFGDFSGELFALTLQTSNPSDGCSPLPASTPNLASKVVLIRRGTCSFDAKVANVKAYGAKKVLFYNNVDGSAIAPGGVDPDVSTGMVSDKQGAKFISQLSAGVPVMIKFTELENSNGFTEFSPNTIDGGFMSYFTTMSPTNEMYIKPAVSAPGGKILSTLPLNQGGYGVYSGTSMATPYIAGVVALMKQVRGKSITPQEIIGRLSSTATPVTTNDGTKNLAPVIQQGGGLVNAYEAIHGITTLNIDVMALNDTKSFYAAHPFTIKNPTSSPIKYTFSNIPAVTVLGMDGVWGVPQAYPVETISANATIRFNPTSITIPANSEGVATAHFTRPSGLDAKRLPLYSGYIGISGSNGESRRIPYAGTTVELKQVPQADGGYGGYVLDSATYDYLKDSNFTFAGPNSTYVPERYPVVGVGLSIGSAVIRVEILPRDVHNLPRFVGKQALGSLPTTPWKYVSRNGGSYRIWDGRMADGTYAPPGDYRFLVRWLKLTGDPTRYQDFTEYWSDYITITYK